MSCSRLIVIAGGSGSGKSHLTRHLHGALAPRSITLTLDHFYHDLGHLTLEQRARNNFDLPDAIDWDSVEKIVAQLTSGHPAEIPRYDFASHTRTQESDLLKSAPFLILEGLWPLTRPVIRDSAALSIFVDCDADRRLARRIARDTVQRGRSEESVRHQFRQQVEPMHELHVQPQAAAADLVIGPDSGDEEVAALLRHPAFTIS